MHWNGNESKRSTYQPVHIEIVLHAWNSSLALFLKARTCVFALMSFTLLKLASVSDYWIRVTLVCTILINTHYVTVETVPYLFLIYISSRLPNPVGPNTTVSCLSMSKLVCLFLVPETIRSVCVKALAFINNPKRTNIIADSTTIESSIIIKV